VAATRARDIFILAVVFICAGIAWLTSLVGLSLALGAFLAGIALADSEYGHQALADMLPLREIFTSLFFLSMGMLLDVRVVADAPGAILATVGALVVGKAAIAAVAGLVVRFPLRVAVLAGLALAQVGEFSFVLAALGQRLGLVGPAEMRLFFAASVLTMLVTPFALRYGPHAAAGAARLRALDRLFGRSRQELARVPESLVDHVLVLGYGVGGRMLAEVLRSAGVPFVVLDLNAESVRESRRRDEPVHYGDVTSPEILARAHVAAARQVAVLLNDPGATLRAVRVVRGLAPRAVIVARARYVADVQSLLQAGANEAVAQEFEASLEVIRRVMKGEGAPTALPGRLPAGLEVESLPVHEGDWLAGRSLAEAQLRVRSGATVVSMSRGAATAVNPGPHELLAAGDVLCLVGDDDQIARARSLAERGP
ncbi:MAG TPA: cation:proton antiporter, partial [Vicinamibacteria bacterium]